jgi:hypothetical protein
MEEPVAVEAADQQEKPPAPEKKKVRRVRRHVVHYRLSPAELDEAKAKAKAADRSLSAYTTMAVLKRRDRRPIVPEANKELHGNLGKLLGNVNQIAYQFNRVAAEDQRPTREVLAELMGERGGELFELLGQVREDVKELRKTLIGVGMRLAASEIEEDDEAKLDTINLFDGKTDREKAATNECN